MAATKNSSLSSMVININLPTIHDQANFFSMAKVSITIEDKDNGKVSVICTPQMSELIGLEISGQGTTSAQGYAIAALNAIRKISKENQSKIMVGIPQLKL